MNPRTFLQEFEQSTDHERLVDVIYDEMVEFCRDNDITLDDISNDEMEQVAEGFVQRGFGVPESDETATSRNEWEATE